MVKVEIVEEKDQQANSPYASSESSRTSSSDIVPPTTRHSIVSKVSRTASFFKRTTKIAGNVIWVQENEMLAQQQGAQQMVSGSSLYPPSPNAQKQGSGQQGLVPPGF
ncbi:mitochondrial import translocase subunit Tom22 [Lactarius sanguifluus]|nr:mitochondrial import translocase subunit Tom22 [Lactarius sanguifluus]